MRDLSSEKLDEYAATFERDGMVVLKRHFPPALLTVWREAFEPLLREQFVLAVPYAPLCSETCKGLCPQCGIDLNSHTCACQKPIDPRLAALKGLKLPT